MSDEFYQKLPVGLKNEHQIGQILWVPSPMTVDSTYTLRIERWFAGKDIAEARLKTERVRLAELGKHCAQERVDMNKMVLPEINLDSSEDLIVNKVKRRPSVLIYRDCFNMRKFATGTAKGPNRHVFAPIYSLKKEAHGEKDYPQDFIEKVKAGGFAHIIYLPPFGTLLKNESMLVLSEMFSVALHAMDPTEYCINPFLFGDLLNTFDTFLVHQAEELEQKLSI